MLVRWEASAPALFLLLRSLEAATPLRPFEYCRFCVLLSRRPQSSALPCSSRLGKRQGRRCSQRRKEKGGPLQPKRRAEQPHLKSTANRVRCQVAATQWCVVGGLRGCPTHGPSKPAYKHGLVLRVRIARTGVLLAGEKIALLG
jgi:hypothetical protein